MTLSQDHERRLREIVRLANGGRPGTFAFAYWLGTAAEDPAHRVYIVGGGRRQLVAFHTYSQSTRAKSREIARAPHHAPAAAQYAALAEGIEQHI